jgi:hypothetical protein
MPLTDALLDVERGAVVAPAGCGKTQLITAAIAAFRGRRPILVLTHTNAGVAALRARLERAGVAPRAYRVMTLDGWAMRLASMFPARSGLRAESLELRDPRRDYPAIQEAAVRLLGEGHLADLLRSTYERILIDEYQDSNDTQHALICHVAEAVQTVVLGDPLQAIFGFAGNMLPDWDAEVCARFPVYLTLDTPWRWLNAGADELGRWLLALRDSLRLGADVDLGAAPSAVEWVELTGDPNRDRPRQLRAARTKILGGRETALILSDSRNRAQQRRFAAQINGAAMVEAVDLIDFVAFADGLDTDDDGAALLHRVVAFASQIMAGVGTSKLLQRVDSHMRRTARNAPSCVESAALRLRTTPSAHGVAEVFEELNRQGGVHVYRPVVLRACFEMACACQHKPGLRFGEAARKIRDDIRAGRRQISNRAVGSTLLMKGLEADIAVVLDTASMDAKHLYVAMTRGAKRLVVCSPSDTLRPAAVAT